MDLLEAIELRCSRRSYLPEALEGGSVEVLRGLIEEYNQVDGVDMRLVLDNGAAFAGLRRSYGMFSGVQNYIGLIDKAEDVAGRPKMRPSISTEKMGYYGELLVLNATALGLGTCWVAGSFDRKLCPFTLEPGEEVTCCITVGAVADDLTSKERFIRGIVHRKTKSAEEMLAGDAPFPDWVMGGMRAVQKAPSAANRQPVRFTYRDGQV
ncbi:MAG: hypothetical protein FWD72_04815, partial [Eggerthellaceae bacterium]|nr:hypothetical protein [Eggerthellaceae bacterium]